MRATSPYGKTLTWSIEWERPAEAFYIYLSRRNPGQGRGGVDACFAQLVDQDGCVYDSIQNGAYVDEFALRMSQTGILTTDVEWFRFETFPRREKKFRLIVYAYWHNPSSKSWQRSFAQFAVVNPAAPPRIARWPVETLPLAQTQDHVSFILTKVTLKTNTFPLLPLNLKAKGLEADYKFTEDGQPSTNWQALDSDLFDSSGNFVAGESGYQGSLCPRETAWKMRVKFFGSEKSRVASNAVWTLRGLAVPIPGQFTVLNCSNELQGVRVEAVTFGGPGNVTYGSNSVLGVSPTEPIANNSVDILSVIPIWFGKHSIAQPGLSAQAEVPHLAVWISDLSTDQRLTVHAVDDQGREFYGYTLYSPASGLKPEKVNYLRNWIVGNHWYFPAFDLPADAKTVDLTFCVHTCRTAEFIFQPTVMK